MELLGARNEALNKWLGENPLVLGGIAVAIGLVLVGLGASALMTGKATGKYGQQMEGNTAKMMGFVWAGFGSAAVLFGLFKIATGLM